MISLSSSGFKLFTNASLDYSIIKIIGQQR